MPPASPLRFMAFDPNATGDAAIFAISRRCRLGGGSKWAPASWLSIRCTPSTIGVRINTSPYLPNSIFYQNWLYLDVEGIPDFAACPRAQRLWAKPEIQQEVAALRASEFVEYERVHALKMRFLKLLFATFLREYHAGSPRAREFQEYIAREGELLRRFATYCALDEWIHRRNPNIWLWTGMAGAVSRSGFRRKPKLSGKNTGAWFCFTSTCEWQIDVQLAPPSSMPAIKDCPSASIMIWRSPPIVSGRICGRTGRFFAAGCRVGSPPDDFSPKGQDWAFPPPNSAQHRESGYQLFVESIRQNCRHGGALRIDHVMRFFRLYWIPDGDDAAHGAYVRDHWEDLDSHRRPGKRAPSGGRRRRRPGYG